MNSVSVVDAWVRGEAGLVTFGQPVMAVAAVRPPGGVRGSMAAEVRWNTGIVGAGERTPGSLLTLPCWPVKTACWSAAESWAYYKCSHFRLTLLSEAALAALLVLAAAGHPES